MLQEIGSPRTLAGKDKHYFVTRDMSGRERSAGGDKPLPVNLAQVDAEQRFSFVIGDDLEAAGRQDAGAAVRLLITFNASVENRTLRVVLNGRDLEAGTADTHLYLTTVAFADPPMRRGDNELAISLLAGGGLYVEGIEVKIAYETA